MKIRHSTSLIALAAVLGTTGFAMAGTTNSFDASVSVLSPDQTGFIIGGQVSVGGVGTAALTLSRSVAEMALVGNAASIMNMTAGAIDDVNSTADITSSLAFDRNIDTSGALVGLGSVVSRGEAIAALGSAGAASANTTTAGTRDALALGPNDAGGEGNATAEASAQGSLNGSLSTSNSLQLLGSSGLFAGSNGLSLGESNLALAYGSSDVTSDGVTGVALNNAQSSLGQNPNLGASLLTATGDGALFNVSSQLADQDASTTGINRTIGLSVSNAGNGTISITTSTGGFFTGGGAAAGSATFADTNEFFGPSL